MNIDIKGMMDLIWEYAKKIFLFPFKLYSMIPSWIKIIVAIITIIISIKIFIHIKAELKKESSFW